MNWESHFNYILNQLFTEKNDAIITHAFDENYTAIAGSKSYKGHDFLFQWNKKMLKALDNIEVMDIQIHTQTENKIAWQRTLKGRHVSSLNGIPASGKTVTWTEMLITEVEDKRITKEWLVSELAGALCLARRGKLKK